MVLVRMVLQAPQGRAGEMASLYGDNLDRFKRFLGADVPIRILTDLSGPFDTVVLEITVENLAAWEKHRAAMFSSPEFQQIIAERDGERYRSGQTEFYTIEAEA